MYELYLGERRIIGPVDYRQAAAIQSQLAAEGITTRMEFT